MFCTGVAVFRGRSSFGVVGFALLACFPETEHTDHIIATHDHLSDSLWNSTPSLRAMHERARYEGCKSFGLSIWDKLRLATFG
jgi:hypothetical protein